MSKKPKNIFQFKILLNHSDPEIWRRIQVPENYSFWDLHVAIQDAMGWFDEHLHLFTFTLSKPRKKIEIGIPDPDWANDPILPVWETAIKNYFSLKKKKAIYEYDFGDGWEHTISLEKIIPADPNIKYPLCIGGERACPPEDCGGIGRYQHILQVINNPDKYKNENDDDYEDVSELLEWLGDDFDPEDFSHVNVEFDNPKKRFNIAFS